MNEKITTTPQVAMPPILFIFLAVFLALAWIIPNHTKPWTTFHSEALASAVLLVVALWVLVRTPGKLEPIGLGLFFLALAAVPWLQFGAGIIYSFGVAWITSLFVIAFAMALFVGWHWEKMNPGECLDFLFLAFGIGAVVSVGIQLLQWLQLAQGSFLVLEVADHRFAANMGQANQLASLLLLATVGVGWGYAKNALRPTVALLLVLFLLFGVVLTDSRTAKLNVVGMLVALFVFWRTGRPKNAHWVLLGLGVYFFALNYALPIVNQRFFGLITESRAQYDSVRPEMWASLSKALMAQPWTGYGWGQTAVAMLAAPDFPGITSVTTYAHNLVLDIFLYNGLLLGGIVVAVLAGVFWRFWGHLKDDLFIFPALAVGLLLVHAMLELPLHYAYFLLPFGMIVGVMAHRSGIKGWAACPKWPGFGYVIILAGGLWLTVVDCLEAERTYFFTRFGEKGQAIPPEFLPQLKVMPQWRNRLLLVNAIPTSGLPPEKIRWIHEVVYSTPEVFLMFQLARHLALNGQPDEAREWLGKICKMAPEWITDAFAEKWASEIEADASYRQVGWTRCPPSKFPGGKKPFPTSVAR